MSLRASASAVRGNPLNSEVIASSRDFGTGNDNQSQFTETLQILPKLSDCFAELPIYPPYIPPIRGERGG